MVGAAVVGMGITELDDMGNGGTETERRGRRSSERERTRGRTWHGTELLLIVNLIMMESWCK